IAGRMHESRCHEIGSADLGSLCSRALWCSEDGARLRVIGLDLGARDDRPPRRTRRRAAEAGLALVEEIRRLPGLMVERRPGWFPLADFALQQVLAAVWLTRVEDGDPGEFVDRRHDRLWHGVIELAAGLRLPWWDGAAMVCALIEADRSVPAVPTLLL